jgi:glycosyltransferase involved in cell wall biosynthesis
MKILLLNDRYPPRYQSSVASITSNLADIYETQGHTVSVITSHRLAVSEEILREGNIISLPIEYRSSLRHYKSLKQGAVSLLLDKEIRKIEPDIVHAHNVHMYLTYDALHVAQQYADKVFLTTHDVMSFNYGRLMTRRYLESEGADTHTSARDHIRQAGLQWNPLRNKKIRSLLDQNVTNVVAVSNALKNALDTNGIPKTCVVHNGIDIAKWQASEEESATFRKEHLLEGKKVILFGGRLSRDKGSTPLLHALSQVKKAVPNVVLLVIGNPVTWEGLMREAGIQEDLSEYIRQVDWLTAEGMRAAYGACDVVTTPSLCLDTFNLMNTEAMANSKPVVGTCFGGAPEVVENGVTGFVCNPLKTEEYASLLLTLLSDDALAVKMGHAGKLRVEKLFTTERQAQQYLDLYQN